MEDNKYLLCSVTNPQVEEHLESKKCGDKLFYHLHRRHH